MNTYLLECALLIETHSLYSSNLGDSLKQKLICKNYVCTDELNDVNRLFNSQKFNLMIIDLSLQNKQNTGNSIIHSVQKKQPDTYIIALSGKDDHFKNGNVKINSKTSLVSKTEKPEALILAMKKMMNGQSYISQCLKAGLSKVTQKTNQSVPSFFYDYSLTRREIEIVQMILNGHSNKMIACSFDIAPTTLKKHLQHVYKKFNVNNKTEMLQIVYSEMNKK